MREYGKGYSAAYGACCAAAIPVGILFWKVIVMPYQQGKDIRGCIDGKLEGGPRSLEYAQTAVDVCTARAKYSAF